MNKQVNNSKSKLGKGMAALLGGGSELDIDEKEKPKSLSGDVTLVPIEKIVPNKDQPRKIFNEESIEELSLSIKENGLIQPLIVAQMQDGSLSLIAGERRLRACKKAGLDKVAVVFKKVTQREKLLMAIIENVQREDLNCVEEALAYFQLMSDFKLTQEEVAKKIGKERSSIANYLRILKLPREVIDLLQKEKLTLGHAKVLGAIKNEEEIKKVAKQAAEHTLSVRELEQLINTSKQEKPKNNRQSTNDLEPIRRELEAKTGLHIKLKQKKNGSGCITINFSDKSEFNEIYKYFME